MKYYEVWGWDTFASESYFCGRYASRKEAESELREKKREVKKTQDEGLRDTFSIVEIADEEIKVRDEERDRMNWEKADERFFDPVHLAGCVRELLTRFKEEWKNIDPEELMKREERKRVLRQEVEWCDEKDCFTRIAFETFYTKNRMLAVGIEASIRGGVYYGSGCISKSCVFMDTLTGILRWVDTKGAGDECSFKFQELIESFFKG